ncbi:MAG: acyl-CoA thioesterase [Alphaproteobacteria bacterium]|nr:acyl-CoA thioesterase [Alphaproteobacteria bacterium]MBQ8256162.1 acyl-CoA thioesterase [Alphaproteobacteria bacterium]
MKEHVYPFTVAYADTDAEGIVYHARYLEIAERARMNWLRGHVVVGDDIGFVIRELNIKYLQPLKAADDFVVKTVMTDVGVATVKIEQKFVKDGNVCAIINLKVAYLGVDMRPKRIPAEFIEQLV